jgi:hypothetical protein
MIVADYKILERSDGFLLMTRCNSKLDLRPALHLEDPFAGSLECGQTVVTMS